MDSDLLLANIRSEVSITDAEWQYIASLAIERTFKKGQFINREGEVNRFTNFIQKSSVRVYYIDGNGHEHVIQLGIRGWWVSDFASFITQKPGVLYVEALEPTAVISFSYDHLQLIYEKVPVFERFYRLLIQKAYSSFQHRMLQSLSMDAEERYMYFRENYPDMEAQLSQKHIASYLGMSAEFLSKIKKRVLQKSRSDHGLTSSL